jgi:hypothetical protein
VLAFLGRISNSIATTHSCGNFAAQLREVNVVPVLAAVGTVHGAKVGTAEKEERKFR